MSAGCLDTRLARDLNPGTTQTMCPGSAAQCLYLLLLAPPRSSCVCSNCLATTVHPGDPAAMSAVTAWPLQFTWATLQLCLQQLPSHCPPPAGDNNKTQDKRTVYLLLIFPICSVG